MWWILASIFSALFAGITTILSKCGIKNTNSNVATAIRTSVVLIFAWLIVFITGAYNGLTSIGWKSWLFLILSGLATGGSWVCYFKALSIGEASRVTAVDKSSVILSVLLAIIIFPVERANWWIKLICLVLIGVGTFLMIELKGQDKKGIVWIIFAVLSAIFASLTSILAKVGIEGVDSNLATAIRTAVVLVLAWIIVLWRKEGKYIKEVPKKDFLFLVLSGIATGASWLCYYYAIQNGQVSIVIPIDKLSILITVLFSAIFLKEKISIKGWVGLFLITSGTILMAIFG